MPPINTRLPTRPAVVAITWATALPKARARQVLVAMMLLTGLLDIVTGRGVSLTALYLIATYFSVWTLGEGVGFGVAILCTLMSYAANGFGDGHSALATTLPAWQIAWNLLMRSLSFSLSVAVVGGFRRCFDQQRTLARLDPLTGLLNKRAFFEEARGSLAQATRHGRSAVLAYVDLDGFKAVNDRFGHAAGDTLLRGFAEAATGRLRPYDLAGRIGGDEFVFLLSVPSGDVGLVVAERIHANLSACLIHAPCAVTCSTGAIVIDAPGEQEGEALALLADSLMYEVKRAGKNAVRVATVPMRARPAVKAPAEGDDRVIASLVARLGAMAAQPRRDAA